MSRNSFWSYSLFGIVAMVIGIFSYNTIWLGDDINYAFDFRPNHNNEVVSSLGQVLQSLNAHYIEVNGRHFPHILVQMFVGIWGRTAFAIANGLMYVAFLWSLCRLCRLKLKNFKGVVSVSLFALIVFQTKMTPSCQIGYIWTFTLVMIYLILFFSERPMDRWWQLVLLSLFSVVAGNGNEGLNLGISAALIIYWIPRVHNLSLRRYLMMVCFGIGTLVICVSPAAHSRAIGGNNTYSILWWLTSLVFLFKTVIASFILICVIFYKKKFRNLNVRDYVSANSFFVITWAVLFVFNILIGFYTNRQVLGMDLVATILLFRLLQHHSFNYLGIITSAVILLWLYKQQCITIEAIRRNFESICKQYHVRSDGVVYVNYDYESNVPYSMSFSPDLPFMVHREEANNYELLQLHRYLNKKVAKRDSLVLLPDYLPCIRSYSVSRYVKRIPSSNIYILSLPISDSLRPKVSRCIDLGMITYKLPSVEIDLAEDKALHEDSLIVKYIDMWDYTFLNLSKNQIIFE